MRNNSPLFMTLLVRDEVDVVKKNIDFHLSRGVDHIVAIDNDSRDGTREVLEEYERTGAVTLFQEDSGDYQQMVWVNRMVSHIREKYGNAWVINNDADEFWRPPDQSNGDCGNLRDLVNSSDASCVECERFNMINIASRMGRQPWIDLLIWRSVVASRPTPAELKKHRAMTHPFFCFKLPNKVLVHTRDLVRVSKGCHSAEFRSKIKPVDLGIEIFHYPVREIGEFEQSIRHISQAVLRDAGRKPNESLKYLRWRRILEGGGSAYSVIEDSFPSPWQLLKYRLSGNVVKDVRMRDDLRKLSQY